MKNLMKYCVILSTVCYCACSADSDKGTYKEPVKVQSEAERQNENLKALMESLASDLCNVDPKHELSVVYLNNEEIKCK